MPGRRASAAVFIAHARQPQTDTQPYHLRHVRQKQTAEKTLTHPAANRRRIESVKPHPGLRPDCSRIAEPQSCPAAPTLRQRGFQSSIFHRWIFQKPGLHLLAVLAVQLFNSLATRLAMGSAVVLWLMNTALPRVDDAGTNGCPSEIFHLLDSCTFDASSTRPSGTQMQPKGLTVILVCTFSTFCTTLPMACIMTSNLQIRIAICRMVRQPSTIRDTACTREGVYFRKPPRQSTCRYHVSNAHTRHVA